jgi:hypothetical protein
VKPISAEQILPYEEWERVRPVLRPLFIREKDRRRLAVGEHLTLLFENAQSVWYQIEEMLRVERIVDGEATQHEIETYNDLIPREDELSATLLIEYADAVERDKALRQLVGLERHLHLVAGDRRVPASFSASQMSSDQVSSVQFIRFPLQRGIGARFVELAQSGNLAIEVDHPELSARSAIDGSLARALLEDLS